MYAPHPAIELLLFSGLVIFWLIPLSSWLMLSGQRDRPATLWFTGAGLYATVATVHVFSLELPMRLTGPLVGVLALLSVLCMVESLRRETAHAPTPWRSYLGVLLLNFFILSFMFKQAELTDAGRAVNLLTLSVADMYLMVVVNQVRRQHQSRALWLIMGMLLAYVLSNLSRILELLLTGHFSQLMEFTPYSNVSLIVNYLSVIICCYGYWGFVVEKNRQQLMMTTEQAAQAHQGQSLALQRERMAQNLLRERTSFMERVAAIGKLAQSGALSASIAHEVNQPLAAIQLNIEESSRMAADIQAPAQLRMLLQRIAQDNQRATQIVRRIRTLFGPGAIELKKQNLDELVRFVIGIVGDRLKQEGIKVRLRLAADQPFWFAAGEVEHVLMNLLDNATHALQLVPSGLRCIDIETWREPGWGFLAVCDNGNGIDSERVGTIFELTETNKPHGMGLGLWLSRYIVERFGGTIALDEKHSPGARFVLKLSAPPSSPPPNA